MKFIALDCETTGLDPYNSNLLVAYFAILDENMTVIDELELRLKPEDKIYQVTAEALAVNGIDLVEHDKIATTKVNAGKDFREFIIRNSKYGIEKLIPVGHNVTFDLEYIGVHLLNKKEFQQFISYRILDTGVITQFFKHCGKIPFEVGGSLTSLVKHFGLTFTTKAHDAKSDTLATIEVYKKLKELL